MISRKFVAGLAVATVVTGAAAWLKAKTRSFVGQKTEGAAFAHVDASGPEWQFEGGAGAEKLASVPLPVRSGTVLWVRLDLDQVAGVVDPVIVDLVGPGYDNDEQEFHLELTPRDQGAKIQRLLFTDWVPEPASTRLRVFDYASARFSIARLSVTSLHLVFLLPFLLSASLLALALTTGVLARVLGGEKRSAIAVWEAAWARGGAALQDSELLAPALVALIVCCLVGIVLALPYPLLASDEFPYAFRSKFGWEAFAGESGILPRAMPNLLYLRLFHWVHAFDDTALTVARAFNTVLFALAAFPLYWLFRRFATPGTSALLALVSCAGPTSSYAAYFMPEAMYFFGFWWVILLFARLLEKMTLPRVLAMALGLAALALVKPHAMVLLVCFCLILPLLRLFQPARPMGRLLLSSIALAGGWYLAWLALASRLGGRLLLNPVGVIYGDAAGKVLAVRNLSAVASAFAAVLGEHLAIVILIFGVPFSLVMAKLGHALRHRREGTQGPGLDLSLALTSIVVPGALILMTSKFTVLLAEEVVSETVSRLHGRYYSFSLPLLVLGAAAARPMLEMPARLARWVWFAASLLLMGAALWIFTKIGHQYVVDFPEAYALIEVHPLLELVVAANLAVTFLALFRPRWAWRLLLGSLTLFSLIGASYVFDGQRTRGKGLDEDRMGIALRSMLTRGERDEVRVFSREVDVRSSYLGVELLSLARFQSATDLSDGHCALLPDSARYLVTLDPIPVGCGYHPVLRIGSTSLFEQTPGR